MGKTYTIVVGTLAAALAVGGFSLGHVTSVTLVQAESLTKHALATPAGLPSFATLAPQVSPAVVHIKVVVVERADFQHRPQFGFPPGPFGESPPVSGRLFPFHSPAPVLSVVRARALLCARMA